MVLMAVLLTSCADETDGLLDEEEDGSTLEMDASPLEEEEDADLDPAPEDASNTVSDATLADAAAMDASLPDAQVPDAALPDALLPDASPLDATLSDATLPDATLADATLPDASKPDATLPDASLPDATLPDASLPDATTPDASGPATFTQVQAIFSSRCGGCHGTNGGLTLSSTAAYAELLRGGSGAPAEGSGCGSSGKLRVVPSSPTSSLLLQKVENTAGCGSRMPPSGSALTSTQIDTIRSWIAAGALNN